MHETGQTDQNGRQRTPKRGRNRPGAGVGAVAQTEYSKEKGMKCAIYCRLSREDGEKTAESESIQNQKSLLINYAVERGWDIYHIYCDAAVKIGLSR